LQDESVRVKTITASGDKIFFIGLLGLKEILSKEDYSYLVLVEEVDVGNLLETVVDGEVKTLGHEHVLVFVMCLKLHIHVAAFTVPWPIAVKM